MSLDERREYEANRNEEDSPNIRKIIETLTETSEEFPEYKEHPPISRDYTKPQLPPFDLNLLGQVRRRGHHTGESYFPYLSTAEYEAQRHREDQERIEEEEEKKKEKEEKKKKGKGIPRPDDRMIYPTPYHLKGQGLPRNLSEMYDRPIIHGFEAFRPISQQTYEATSGLVGGNFDDPFDNPEPEQYPNITAPLNQIDYQPPLRIPEQPNVEAMATRMLRF